MSNMNAHLDLYLTEVSIELLGNKIYDLNGKRQDHLMNLLKALPQDSARQPSIENSNDFLCSIGFQSDYTKENSSKELLNEQLDFILEDGNTSDAVNADIVKTLQEYKQDQPKLVSDVTELNIAKLVGKSSNLSRFLMTHYFVCRRTLENYRANGKQPNGESERDKAAVW